MEVFLASVGALVAFDESVLRRDRVGAEGTLCQHPISVRYEGKARRGEVYFLGKRPTSEMIEDLLALVSEDLEPEDADAYGGRTTDALVSLSASNTRSDDDLPRCREALLPPDKESADGTREDVGAGGRAADGGGGGGDTFSFELERLNMLRHVELVEGFDASVAVVSSMGALEFVGFVLVGRLAKAECEGIGDGEGARMDELFDGGLEDEVDLLGKPESTGKNDVGLREDFRGG